MGLAQRQRYLEYCQKLEEKESLLQLQTNLEEFLNSRHLTRPQLMLVSSQSVPDTHSQKIRFVRSRREQDGANGESVTNVEQIVTTAPAPNEDEWILVTSQDTDV